MADIKEIVNEIGELETLRTVTQAYSEIASLRMRTIRDFVLKNRDFLGAIDSIFRQVLYSYQEEVEELIKNTKDKDKVTFLAHNGKTVAVLLSANTGLYGDIVSKTFNKFLKEVEKANVEVSIVGKLGASLFEQTKPNTPFTYFDFPDYQIDSKALTEIIRHIVQYEKIEVYYGKFMSVVTQSPSVYTINAITTNTIQGAQAEEKKEKYIFEPTLEEVLRFFETEIFTSLFDQTIRESQLAKFASRIGAMSQATENISENIKNAENKRLKVIHSIANRKQLNSLSRLLIR